MEARVGELEAESAAAVQAAESKASGLEVAAKADEYKLKEGAEEQKHPLPAATLPTFDWERWRSDLIVCRDGLETNGPLVSRDSCPTRR